VLTLLAVAEDMHQFGRSLSVASAGANSASNIAPFPYWILMQLLVLDWSAPLRVDSLGDLN
jgi:hypothetical protein